jgi:hypothetical protein
MRRFGARLRVPRAAPFSAALPVVTLVREPQSEPRSARLPGGVRRRETQAAQQNKENAFYNAFNACMNRPPQ